MAGNKGRNGRGFASMSEEKRRAIASKGGQAQPTEAKRRGGQHSHDNDR